MGLPDLPFHLRLDLLSGFFLVVIGLLAFFVSIYSLGYVKGYLGHRPVTSLVVFYSLFLAGMILVVLADDAFFFLIAWEMMAAASYFLVLFEDERMENRRAAFLYLVVAHVGAIAILLSFGIMAGLATGFKGFEGYTFDAMRETDLPAGWASIAFLLAFFGFSAKAGVIPLHVWLPEAHPVAPSNVSALMSGVMLKTAIYGIVRVVFDLIGVFPWWWGALVLVFGLVSAVMGVLYALMQHDLKRLLAYHSVENIGIILIGIGLAMIFTSFDMSLLAALALIAGLYHTLNHAMFKGLLFMGAGAVLHATHERNMEEMGGLIRFMPWTAVLFLIGCISISALPPFNGFVSGMAYLPGIFALAGASQSAPEPAHTAGRRAPGADKRAGRRLFRKGLRGDLPWTPARTSSWQRPRGALVHAHRHAACGTHLSWSRCPAHAHDQMDGPHCRRAGERHDRRIRIGFRLDVAHADRC